MSLLRDIQDAAIDSETDLASLLRKCKVLAARLGSVEFGEWVDNELDGYLSRHELPDYRILSVSSKGHFSGAYGSGLRNADIPLSCLPKKWHEVLSHSYMAEPVASIENLVIQNKHDRGTVQEPWNPDLVITLGKNIVQQMQCIQAWKVVPVGSIVGLLDQVRNRILKFALEIEAQDPAAGEAELNSNPVEGEKVSQIFNTYISGNVQNLATASHDFEQHSTNNDPDLFGQLSEALKSLGRPEITTTLEKNIHGMRESQGTNGFKEHYQKFMSSLSDHITILGPVVAPFLPSLAAI